MFNYKCPECGKGIVREKREPYEVNFRGIKFLVPDAILGVCDHCGAKNFDGKEYKRWEKLFEKSLHEKQKPLSPAEIKRIREQLGLNQRQFAVLIGCTRQSVYNWENTKRRVPQSRQADLMIRLLAERLQNENVDVLGFFFVEAKKVGVKLPQMEVSKPPAHQDTAIIEMLSSFIASLRNDAEKVLESFEVARQENRSSGRADQVRRGVPERTRQTHDLASSKVRRRINKRNSRAA